ncbi:Rha family transcriptional regulator, partial [Ventosimonas gracilis]|uniref:Rha family transcriptional regulator n=1 Tax=Ventosimonas gracilis TaxID=1680762 RepID=UPI000B24CBC5
MNALIPTQSRLTMTSREIADLTGKQHSNVMRDIRNLLDTLSMDSSLNPCAKSIAYDEKDGRAYAQYEVDKDTCLTLLLGYDPAARMKVVKRWQELEAQGFDRIANAEGLLSLRETATTLKIPEKQ